MLIQGSGGAFGSYLDYTLNSNILELTFNYATGAPDTFKKSTINLSKQKYKMSVCSIKLIEKIDSIIEENRNSVFVYNNGRVDCQAPSTA